MKTETKVTHTPTPWEYDDAGLWGEIDGEHVVIAEDIEVEDAAFIVRAVNAYRDHLETIRWVANTVHQAHHESGVWRECKKNTCVAARQTIARAESA